MSFLEDQAARAGAELAREMWAKLLRLDIGIKVWIIGCDEARELVDEHDAAVFLPDELEAVLARAPAPIDFRTICAAKRSFAARVEEVADEDEARELPSAYSPSRRPKPLAPRGALSDLIDRVQRR